MQDSDIINFTINTWNVYTESNALATTGKTDQEKVENVSKQMETTTEQEYTKLVILQPLQQCEFNKSMQAEQIRITELLN